jgi:uncharacterized membrane protein YraQ (UPF0718 family)
MDLYPILALIVVVYIGWWFNFLFIEKKED